MTVDAGDAYVHGEITAFAYETIPNKPIIAILPKEPPSDAAIQQRNQSIEGAALGMLALGAQGLALWRH
jgi:hypothetical protein